MNLSTECNRCLLASLLACAMAGCGPAVLPGDAGPIIKFDDKAPANASVASVDLLQIKLQDIEGQQTAIEKLRGGRPLVLIITRGLVGSGTAGENTQYGLGLCTYCSTQISRLIANHSDFRKRNAEIIAVFPVARSTDQDKVQAFAARVQGGGKTTRDCPFPILLDIDLQAVDALGIRANLSKPATYIIDAAGQVRYAYVGKTTSDRPSVKALLDQLDAIARQP
jgi:peroxiredoxin